MKKKNLSSNFAEKKYIYMYGERIKIRVYAQWVCIFFTRCFNNELKYVYFNNCLNFLSTLISKK